MRPDQAAEINAVAGEIERFGMTRSALRLRTLVTRPADERVMRVQDDRREVQGIPWGLAMILFPAYQRNGQDIERMHERGGFGRKELGALAVDCYIGNKSLCPRMPILDLYEAAMAANAEPIR